MWSARSGVCAALLFSWMFAIPRDVQAENDWSGTGAVELNATCALVSGCTPADTPGLPITISEPGSYRLTGNITALLPPGSQSPLIAIDVTGPGVSIDLAGFEIACDQCSAAPGLTTAIVHDDAIRVHNGVLRGFYDSIEGTGLVLARDLRVASDLPGLVGHLGAADAGLLCTRCLLGNVIGEILLHDVEFTRTADANRNIQAVQAMVVDGARATASDADPPANLGGPGVNIRNISLRRWNLGLPECGVIANARIESSSQQSVVAKDSVIVHSRVDDSFSQGIVLLDSGVLRHTSVSGANNEGIYVFSLFEAIRPSASLVGVSVTGSGAGGIETDGEGHMLVRESSSTANGGPGVSAISGQVINSTVRSNTSAGIALSSSARVVGNNAHGTSGIGAFLTTRGGHGENVMSGNTTDLVGGYALTPSICGTNTTCP